MDTHVPLQIAIDGPVGSGKSYIASELAKRLGITYLYTGAMYRALALACYRQSIPFKDAASVVPVLHSLSIDLKPADVGSNRPCRVFLNNSEVTEELFTPIIDQGTSDVSTLSEVRKFMVSLQQRMAAGKAVVMEGRDIALRVLPHAQIKIFLTASVEERAKRRYDQYRKKGIEKTYQEILSDTKIRDTQDTTRETDPLQVVPGAWVLDTTAMTPEQVIETIIHRIQQR